MAGECGFVIVDGTKVLSFIDVDHGIIGGSEICMSYCQARILGIRTEVIKIGAVLRDVEHCFNGLRSRKASVTYLGHVYQWHGR